MISQGAIEAMVPAIPAALWVWEYSRARRIRKQLRLAFGEIREAIISIDSLWKVSSIQADEMHKRHVQVAEDMDTIGRRFAELCDLHDGFRDQAMAVIAQLGESDMEQVARRVIAEELAVRSGVAA